MTFALSKTQAPRFRSGLIERHALEARLGEALLGYPLVLLVGAAGFGKTAALARQLSLLPPDCAKVWVTMDAEDDLPRFLLCFFAALEPYDPPWRIAPEALAGSVLQERGRRVVVDEIVNALGAMPAKHGVIALDDVHSVTDLQVFEFLQKLLDSLPVAWTLAIATRVMPPLALARLRGRRELAEFGQVELGFSQDEVVRLCEAMGVADAPAVACRLHERTQGWAAGVCLGLSVTDTASAVMNERLNRRHLFDYLASEVFAQMPEELRGFLMRCSVLPELTAARCAEVTGSPCAARLLDDIERRGLFVSVLDSDELTLRLHDLFRDFLEERLRRQHADELPPLLQRAANGEPDTVRKVNLLLRAGAWDEAAQALSETAPFMLARGEGAQIDRLIEQFPKEVREQSAHLLYASALYAWECSDFARMQIKMRRAAAEFEKRCDTVAATRARVYEALASTVQAQDEVGPEAIAALGELSTDLETQLIKESALLWYTTINGPAAGPSFHLNRMAESLRFASPVFWHRCSAFIRILAGTRGVGAVLDHIAKTSLALAAEHNLFRLQAMARGAEAMLLLWNGNFQAFEVTLQQLDSDEHWLGEDASRPTPRGWTIRALCAAMRSDRLAVRAGPRDEDFYPRMFRWTRTIKGLCGAAVGEWSMVDQALRAWEDETKMRGSFWAPFRVVLEARLALSRGTNETAATLLREAAKTSSDIDRLGLDAMVRVHLAIAEGRLGAAASAWQALHPLVVQVQASGEIGGVLLCGLSSLDELAEVLQQPDVPHEGLAEVKRWARLSRQAQTAQRDEGPHMAGKPVAALPLTARELEVLACIAAGRSNKLIARELDLSPHTVKRHVARILDRLDMSSRGEAAAWYHKRALA